MNDNQGFILGRFISLLKSRVFFGVFIFFHKFVVFSVSNFAVMYTDLGFSGLWVTELDFLNL